MATTSQDLARLLRLLNQPALTNLPAVNATSGEVQIIAVGPGPLDQIIIILEPARQYNLLEYAPQSWWQLSTSLVFAVEQGWIQIPDPNATTTTVPPVQLAGVVQYVVEPANPNIGDLLVWNGNAWVLLPPTTVGYALTSNGPLTVPSYQPTGGGGGGSTITGQTTTGLADGDFGYASANNTWAKAQSDGSQLQATVRAANLGAAGTMAIGGQILAAKFTTAGGSPVPGSEVFVAANADDGGTGAGKLTATAPVSGYLTKVGICLNNTNYGAFKTCVVLFHPGSPIAL
jgi:hypothetical protein